MDTASGFSRTSATRAEWFCARGRAATPTCRTFCSRVLLPAGHQHIIFPSALAEEMLRPRPLDHEAAGFERLARADVAGIQATRDLVQAERAKRVLAHRGDCLPGEAPAP